MQWIKNGFSKFNEIWNLPRQKTVGSKWVFKTNKDAHEGIEGYV